SLERVFQVVLEARAPDVEWIGSGPARGGHDGRAAQNGSSPSPERGPRGRASSDSSGGGSGAAPPPLGPPTGRSAPSDRLGEPLRQRHALLVTGQRLLERELPILQLLDDQLEALQRSLEARPFLAFGP